MHKRAEQRGQSRGDAAGGRRPPPRGQKMPFKAPAFPRRFQQSHPFQRQQRQQPQLQYKQERGQEVEETSDDSSALEASRAAMIARDGPVAMPTSLVVPRDDEYYEAATAKVQSTVQ